MMNDKELVEVEITVKVPKKKHSLLMNLAGLVGNSVEDLLIEEIEGVLDMFIDGGYFEAWTEIAMYKLLEEERDVRRGMENE